MYRYYVAGKEYSRFEFMELLSRELVSDREFIEVFESDNNEDLTIEEYIQMNILDYVDTFEFDNFNIEMLVNNTSFKVQE
jgi:uncharacterized protein YqeY